MSEITVGMKLQSVKSGIIATVLDVNDKYRTAKIMLSNGTSRTNTLGTLKDKRSWRILGEEEEEAVEEEKLVPMPGAEKLAELKDEIDNAGETLNKIIDHDPTKIDPELIGKFVKKAQKLITGLRRDNSGYHVIIEYNGMTKVFDDKNLQNIRSALGQIYRGE